MNSTNPTTVDLTSNEVAVLTALMGDIQVAASAFYAKTATSADVESLGTEVRTFLSAAQTLNERLSGSISERRRTNRRCWEQTSVSSSTPSNMCET